MARQGTYVTVPGGSANWAQGITSALADLSKSYMQQGAAEDERARLAEVQQYQRSRDALADKRYDEKAALEKAQREALQGFVTDYSPVAARTAAFAASPELQRAFDERMQTEQETLARNFLADLTLRGEQGRMLREQAAEFGTPLLESSLPEDSAAYLKELQAKGQISADDWKDYQGRISSLKDKVSDYVAGSMPVYQKAEAARITKELMARGVPAATATATATSLAGQYDSKKDLTAAAYKAKEAADKSAKEEADLAYKVWNTQYKGASKNTSGIKPGNVGIEDVEKHIAGIDAGWYDSGTLMNYWQAAVDKGVNPKVAQAALDSFVNTDRWGKSIKGTSDDFVRFADALEAANTSGGDRSKYTDYRRFLPKYTELVDPIQQNKAAFLGGRLDLSPKPMLARDTSPDTIARVGGTPVRSIFDIDPAGKGPYTRGSVRPQSAVTTALPNANVANVEAEKELQRAIEAELGAEAAKEVRPTNTDVLNVVTAKGARDMALTPQAAAHAQQLEDRMKQRAITNAKQAQETKARDIKRVQHRLSSLGKTPTQMHELFKRHTTVIGGKAFDTPNFSDIANEIGSSYDTVKQLYYTMQQYGL